MKIHMNRTYNFPATAIEKITDGDTYWLHLDIGFRQSMLAHLRLHGWDTPELRRGSDHEKTMAKAATRLAGQFIQEGITTNALWVATHKDPDNFGRWLADIIRDDTDLGTWLANLQLAVPWPTRWREIYDVEETQGEAT